MADVIEKKNVKAALRRLVLTWVAALAALSPWFVLSYLSSGAPIFPLGKGNFTFLLRDGADKTVLQKLTIALREMWALGAFCIVYPLVASLLLRTSLRFVITTAVGFVLYLLATGYFFAGSESYAQFRFLQPVLAAGMIALTARVLDPRILSRRDWRVPAAACVLAVGLFQWQSGAIEVAKFSGPPEVLRNYRHSVANFQLLVAGPVWYDWKAGEEAEEQVDYQRVQNSIPAGARVLSVVMKPYLWDYSRNPIDSIDFPGMASPPPGLPLSEGPEAVLRYLDSLGYQYIVWSSAGLRTPYRLDNWERLVQNETVHPGYRAWVSPVMKFLELLATLERKVAPMQSMVWSPERHFVVIDIQSLVRR